MRTSTYGISSAILTTTTSSTTLTAEELEEAVGSLLKKGFSRIDKVLADAGFGREEVDPLPSPTRAPHLVLDLS